MKCCHQFRMLAVLCARAPPYTVATKSYAGVRRRATRSGEPRHAGPSRDRDRVALFVLCISSTRSGRSLGRRRVYASRICPYRRDGRAHTPATGRPSPGTGRGGFGLGLLTLVLRLVVPYDRVGRVAIAPRRWAAFLVRAKSARALPARPRRPRPEVSAAASLRSLRPSDRLRDRRRQPRHRRTRSTSSSVIRPSRCGRISGPHRSTHRRERPERPPRDAERQERQTTPNEGRRPSDRAERDSKYKNRHTRRSRQERH